MNSSSNSFPFLIFLSSLLLQFSLSSAQPDFRFSFCNNDNGNYTNTSTSAYVTNLNTLFSNITSQTGETRFYNLSTGTGVDQVNGIALCRGDVSPTACMSCLSNAAGKIRAVCPIQKEAIGWYDECMLRYSNGSIFARMESSPLLANYNTENATNPSAFNRQLGNLLRRLMSTASAGDSRRKFASDGPVAVTDFSSIYGLVECTPDLTSLDCSNCIQGLISYIPTCCDSKIGGTYATPSCNLRYEANKFFDSDDGSLSPPLPPPSNRTSSPTTGRPIRKIKSSKLSVFIAIPTIMASLLAIGIWICHRWRKAMQTTDHEIEEIIEAESLQFDLNTIKAATCNFSLDNKLGQGGFGEVYKGKLGSGQEVAVKRLSKNSGQGVAEFKTEVVLVAKLQHKNLVKLLGFCMALKEKLLVYEFLPNSSLDRFLFDPTKSTLLDWETRFKIILGIARGLLYLHEDSRLKVIHRDLKSSNILLDESMNPKISDFGLAKLFGMDQTQGDTGRIVGTYGYMAPEYAMTGHFSAKSDVYSFGMIVLEILTAQKNGHFARPEAEEPLVYRAWRLWNEEKVLDLLDPSLGNKYEPEEVKRCIHIGLLSIQEDPVRRPRMTTVVAVLNGDSINLPMPKAPQFLGNPTSFGDETTTSYPCTMTVNITDLHPR